MRIKHYKLFVLVLLLLGIATSIVIVLGMQPVEIDAGYYQPLEHEGMDLFNTDSHWTWSRSAQSEHFIVFWEAGFGDNPSSDSVPENMRVDVDDLLLKAELYFERNTKKLNFSELGSGKSWLDMYKMQIYLFYQEDWLATGAGYDNTIGALWVNPSTCQPAGSTIAHEIGHCFQYQVYSDQLKNGLPIDVLSGFRYGHEGSTGGNTFWEQTAQWQAFQDYPAERFEDHNLSTWLRNSHRAFENEWFRYESFWLLDYWTNKHGLDTVATIWRESVFPEDSIATYMRIYQDSDVEKLNDEMYDFAAHMATFDIEGAPEYSSDWLNSYQTMLYQAEDGYEQVAYANCPGIFGFNVIEQEVPETGTEVIASFVGLKSDSALSSKDPGEYLIEEKMAGNTKVYNASEVALGWRYGFVALGENGVRVYGELHDSATGTARFLVPEGTEKLFFVVLGAPKEPVIHPWNENELDDVQFPYKVKFMR